MAFLKYAKARIVTPEITFGISSGGWNRVRQAAALPSVSNELMARAEDILGEKCTPDRYLLTHSTIVCSVDTEKVKGSKMGSVEEEGTKILRKYPDYRITSNTDRFINNNLDSWSRGVLKKSYKSFIGAFNFVEHIQVEELSKGRIIDAVLRDVGDSLYVDILVATDKKHADLVEQIQSGKMNAMSMGCFLPDTQVTVGDGSRVAISDIQVGDHVVTHTGSIKPVKNVMIHSSSEDWLTRTISARGVAAPITATANHPFFVARPVDLCGCGCGEALTHNSPSASRNLLKRFKTGHDKRVFNPATSYSAEELEQRLSKMEEIKKLNVVEVEAKDLKVGDYLLHPRVKEDAETIKVSKAKARLLGYFLAEGSFLKYKGALSGVEFSFSHEEMDSYAAEVKALLLEAFPEANEARVYERGERGSCRVQLSGKEVAQWFKDHGGEYSHQKRLSADAMNWDTSSQLEMLGAWMNGDGHLHNIHGSTIGTTVSYDLACQLHTILCRAGIASSFSVSRKDNRRDAYLLSVGKISSQALLGCCDKVSDKRSHLSDMRECSDYILAPITSIEEGLYQGAVYDLEVEDDHSYLVEGVAVHNCSVDFTICSKCGHVAADETEMCRHIRYEKGNIFYDEKGDKHRIAELCGHEDEGDNGGVTFIEASWVATPAFEGAVARNTLEAPQAKVASQIESVEDRLNAIPSEWLQRDAGMFDDDDAGDDEGGAAPEVPVSILDQLEESVTKAVVDRIRRKIEDEIEGKGKEEAPSTSDSTVSQNDTIVKEGSKDRYFRDLGAALKIATSDRDALNNILILNRHYGVEIPSRIYLLADRMGSANKYPSLDNYLAKAQEIIGTQLSEEDSLRLVRLAKLLNNRAGCPTYPTKGR